MLCHDYFKGLVKPWGWDELLIAHTHFAIKGSLNTIRASLTEADVDNKLWSYVDLSKFVKDGYGDILTVDTLTVVELMSIIEDHYDVEIDEINNRIRSLNNPTQNWAYLIKVTS